MQPSQADLRAFIGPNADYYLRSWVTARPGVELQRLRWNWPAFFLNIVWLLHRRMYRYFWIGFGVLAAIGIVEGVAEASLHFRTPAYIDFAINFSVAYYFGSFGTWFYFRHATETIEREKLQLARPDVIAQAGGVRWLLPGVLGVIGGILVLAAIAVKFGPGPS